MKIIILSDFERPWTIESIPRSLRKLEMPYTIGIIDSGCEYDILHKVNYDLIKQVDLILVLRCDHAFDTGGHFDTADFTNAEIKRTFNAIEKPVLFITHDETIDYGFPSLYYPIYTTIIHEATQLCDIPSFEPKKYLFSCLSNKPHNHRIVNYILFTKSTYFNASLLTLGDWHKLDVFIQHLATWGKEYVDTYLNDILPVLPIISDEIDCYLIQDDYIPTNGTYNTDLFQFDNSAYFDSYVNVVTESYYHVPFISEKILKPIMACQFFVVIAGKHTINLLRELGFDTYDDIINHDMYDNSEDTDRICDVHKLLNIIQWYNWIEIYNNTTERRQANRELIVSLHHETDFINKIKQHIRN